MSALSSSAAMAIKLSQYLLENQELQTIAGILNVPSTGIESVSFERKYPVCADWKAHGFNEPPHLDLGIDYIDSRRVGVDPRSYMPAERRVQARRDRQITDAWRPSRHLSVSRVADRVQVI